MKLIRTVDRSFAPIDAGSLMCDGAAALVAVLLIAFHFDEERHEA
jgi:hypothetical protein